MKLDSLEAAIEAREAATEARVAALEQQFAAKEAALEARIAALESRLAGGQAAPKGARRTQEAGQVRLGWQQEPGGGEGGWSGSGSRRSGRWCSR